MKNSAFLHGAHVWMGERGDNGEKWYIVGPKGFLRGGGSVWDKYPVQGTFIADSREKADHALQVLLNE